MPRAERQYVRVYHDDLQRDYGTVWVDDAALATWLRLLVVADKMWPSIPELPRSVKPRPLGTLVEKKLVVLLPAHGYRIRGHDEERRKRQESARNAAGVRWDSERSAEVMPSPRPSPSPSPKDPPNPPRGARSRTSGNVDRKAKPESLGSILRRAAQVGHDAA